MKGNDRQKIESASLKTKYIWVAVVTMTTIVYLIPYTYLDFYNHFLEAFHVTDGQAGKIMTFFGLTATPGYLVGGWLADKFNPKKLVVISTLATGIIGLVMSFVSGFAMLAVIYFIFGITTTCMHWGAFLKMIKSWGSAEEQGRLFGVENSMFGAVGLISTYVILGLVTFLFKDAGFRGGMQVYSIVTILTGLATWLIVPYDKASQVDMGDDKIDFRVIGKVLKMPVTWYLGAFTWGYFMVRSTVPYLNPLMTDVYGIGIALAAFITTTLRSGMNMVFGPIGGYFIDKKGRSTPVVMFGSIATLIFTVAIVILPKRADLFAPFLCIAVLVTISSYLNSSALYTPVTEARVPFAYVGTVLGIASTLGYSTDAWIYNACGYWVDHYGDMAYNFIFMLQAFGAVVMIASGLLLARLYKKKQSEEKETNIAA